MLISGVSRGVYPLYNHPTRWLSIWPLIAIERKNLNPSHTGYTYPLKLKGISYVKKRFKSFAMTLEQYTCQISLVQWVHLLVERYCIAQWVHLFLMYFNDIQRRMVFLMPVMVLESIINCTIYMYLISMVIVQRHSTTKVLIHFKQNLRHTVDSSQKSCSSNMWF